MGYTWNLHGLKLLFDGGFGTAPLKHGHEPRAQLDTKRPSHAVWALSATLIVACMNGSGGAEITASEEALRTSRLEWATFDDPKGIDGAGVAPRRA
jgi:hypothetical protein